MIRACLSLLALVALAGCETAPTAPIVIEPPRVAPVATAQPYVWDSADELAAWVTSSSTGPVAVAGDGTDAVIRVDVSAGNGGLHGPEIDPPLVDVQTVTMRYRWLDAQSNDPLFLAVYLRAPGVPTSLPRLDPPVSSAERAALRSGAWLERSLRTNGSWRPPFTVRYAFVSVANTLHAPVDRPLHGVVEIDWIALVR